MGAPSPTKRTAAPAKRATSRKTAVNETAPPVEVPDDVFDLDSLTKAEALGDLDIPETPLRFLLKGRWYELNDPRDSDWQDAWELANNPLRMMAVALVDGDAPVDDPTVKERLAARDRMRMEARRAEQERLADGDDTTEATGKPADEPTAGEGGDARDEPVEIIVTLIDRFTVAPLPGWKLNALFKRWLTYYKIDVSDGKSVFAALLGLAD